MAKMYRCCAWLVLLALSPGNLVAAPQTPIVAALGRHPKVEFQGCEAFSAAELRRALKLNVNYQAALISTMPVAEFQECVVQTIRSGYLLAGYPHVTVAARIVETPAENEFDDASASLLVEINEGQQYRAGIIGVQGGTLVDVERLRNDLQPLPDGAASSAQPPVEVEWHISSRRHRNWKSGKTVSLTPYSLSCYRRDVAARLAAQGFRWAQFSVQLEPDALTQSVTLKITIEDEGPRARLGSIKISGAKRNSTQSIIQYLSLHEGDVIDAELLDRVWWRLYQAGRFLEFKVSIANEASGATGSVPAQIELEEYDRAPLITEKFTAEQDVLLKFGRWQEQWWHGGDPYRVRLCQLPLSELCNLLPGLNPDVMADIDVSLAPGRAVYLSWMLKLAADQTARQGQILMQADHVDFVFPTQQRRLQLPNWLLSSDYNGRLCVTTSTRPHQSHDPTDRFRYGFGMSLGERFPGDSPIQILSDVAPVAMLDLSLNPKFQCQFEGQELVVKSKHSTYRIDRTTGELNSFRGAISESSSNAAELLIEKDPDGINRIQRMLDEESRIFTGPSSQDASLLSVLALMCNQLDCRPEPLFDSAALEAVQWVGAAFNEALASEKSANGFDAPGRRGFRIPMSPSGSVTQTQDPRVFASWLAQYVLDYNAFLSPDTPLSDAIAMAAAWLSRPKDDWLSESDMQAASESGPNALLISAMLLRPTHAKASFQLANRGRKLHEARTRKIEVDGLVQDDSLSGRMLLHLMRRVKNLSPEEFDVLAERLKPLGHGELFFSIYQQLTESPEEDFRDVSTKAWTQIYEALLQEHVRSGLNYHAPTVPEPVTATITVKLLDDKNVRRAEAQQQIKQGLKEIQQTSALSNAKTLASPITLDRPAGPAPVAKSKAGLSGKPKEFSYLDLIHSSSELPVGGKTEVDFKPAATQKSESAQLESGLSRAQKSAALFQNAEQERVIALVDGKPILTRDILLDSWVLALKSQAVDIPVALNTKLSNQVSDALIEACLQHYIERRLMAQAARKNLEETQLAAIRTATDAEWTKELQQLMQRLNADSPDELRGLLTKSEFDLDAYYQVFAERILSQLGFQYDLVRQYAPGRDELLAYYNKNLHRFSQGGRVRWTELVFPFSDQLTRNNAQRLAERSSEAAAAGADFNSILEAHKDDIIPIEVAAEKWSDQNSLPSPEISAALFSVLVGKTSKVVETPGQFHIVRILERKDGTANSFEKCESRVRELAAMESFHARAKCYLLELHSAASIEIKFQPVKKTAAAPNQIKNP